MVELKVPVCLYDSAVWIKILFKMDFLGKNLNKMRPRRKSIGTIVPPNLQSIPDNDKPVDFKSAEEEARINLVRKQSKRRGSCVPGQKVRQLKIWLDQNLGRDPIYSKSK